MKKIFHGTNFNRHKGKYNCKEITPHINENPNSSIEKFLTIKLHIARQLRRETEKIKRKENKI